MKKSEVVVADGDPTRLLFYDAHQRALATPAERHSRLIRPDRQDRPGEIRIGCRSRTWTDSRFDSSAGG